MRLSESRSRPNMRLNRSSSLRMVILCALGTTAAAQDLHDWQSLERLRAGDQLRLSLKTGPVKAAFQTWTPHELTAGSVTARSEDVLKIERYRPGRRGRHVVIGALIGFGVGFVLGAAGDSKPCSDDQFLCFHVPRGEAGAVFGGLGAVTGIGIGALLPSHDKEVIYSVK